MENAKNLKSSIKGADKEIQSIIDELSGKISYPILDEIEKEAAAQQPTQALFVDQANQPTQPSLSTLSTSVKETSEPIKPLRKPDGSVILKKGSQYKKVEAEDIAPGAINFDSQSELSQLWESNLAQQYQHHTEILSLSGKKVNSKNKQSSLDIV